MYVYVCVCVYVSFTILNFDSHECFCVTVEYRLNRKKQPFNGAYCFSWQGGSMMFILSLLCMGKIMKQSLLLRMFDLSDV